MGSIWAGDGVWAHFVDLALIFIFFNVFPILGWLDILRILRAIRSYMRERCRVS